MIDSIGGSSVVMYGVVMPRDPDDYPINPSPWYPQPYVPVVPNPPPARTLDLETSRELIEALVRQATREHDERIRDLEKRAAAAEARVAQLEARR